MLSAAIRVAARTLPLLVMVGCSKAESATSAATTRDSAGITIVENTEGGPPVPAVDSLPALTIGGGDGGPEYDLNSVRGAVRLSDGRIVVADGASGELRFFDSTGAFTGRAGRKGQGPGEFGEIMALWIAPGDSLLVYDITSRRFSVFDSAGTFARQVDLAKQGFMQPAGRLDDGTLVATGFIFDPTKMPPTGTVYRSPLPVLLIPPDASSPDTFATYQGMEVYTVEVSFGGRTFPNPMTVQFGRSTTVGARGNQVYVGDNDHFEIGVYARDGRPLRLIRTRAAAVPVTAEHRQAQEAQNLEQMSQAQGMPKEMLEQVQGWIKNARYAEQFPPFQTFQLDRAGNLWVQHFSPGKQPARYSVYDSTGSMVARTSLPVGFRPFEIGANYVLGIWTDEDDLQHVRLYRLKQW